MKNLLLLILLATTVISCKTDETNDIIASYDIEGKWLLTNAGGSDLAPNTMYEFQNGIRYTYYCNTTECDDAYWNDQNSNDAIPNTPQYTFTDNTLTIDNDQINTVEFSCDGTIVNIIYDENSTWSWWRIGTDLEACK